MEESRSISEGFTISDAIGEARLRNALTNIKNEVQVCLLIYLYHHSQAESCVH